MSEKAWCVKDPTGKLELKSIAETESKAWKRFQPYIIWPRKSRWYEEGYRCVKVRIEEGW